MNSQDIQTAIYRWAVSQDYTAPYGVLTGDHVSSKGTKYKAVTFGRARTLDCTVNIYNRNFITVTTNRHGNQVFRNYQDCQNFLNTL